MTQGIPTTDPNQATPVTQKTTPEADAQRRETVVESQEFDPGALPSLLKRMSGAASAGSMPEKFRCRKITITIPLEACRLDTYDKPFQLTLQELDSAAELRAYRSMGMSAEEGGAGAVNAANGTMLLAIAIGKEALHAHNGHPLQDHEKDFVWETLSMAGRLAVGNAFLDSGAGIDEPTMGKILDSAVVS